MRSSRLAGIGRAVPERVLTNAELEKMVDTTDAWITERTGIKERHILDQARCTSDLAAEAGLAACRQAELDPQHLDALIVATVTPDKPMPATAAYVQQKIGAGHCPAYDISAACAGFLFGLAQADAYIRAGQCERVLVIGVEILSRILDWTDRGTCVLFGDGAGAAVVTAHDDPNSGLLGHRIHTDGAQADHLQVPAGGSVMPTSQQTVESKQHHVKMNGRKIFTHAVRNMAASSLELLAEKGFSADDVTTVFAHQANMRIIEGVSQRVHIPMTRFYNNISRFGNTSSASIPVAMSEALDQGRIARGDLLLLTALGAGVSWGSALVRW